MNVLKAFVAAVAKALEEKPPVVKGRWRDQIPKGGGQSHGPGTARERK